MCRLANWINWRTVDDYSIDSVLKRSDFWPLPYVDGKRLLPVRHGRTAGRPVPTADANLIEDAERDARVERLHYDTLAALQVFLTYAELTTPA
ncbi:hypothetical protein L2Y90_08660 [Burkholderia pyrrocinia]|uniref:hypothetical protein n=1 Tax=Burkholderia pyrrocinia TaxID=60550 RepID=UPI00215B37C9|nr:hypothetical protein [Burkholderia pyrrocinia]UVE63939.1 hypothetical protein L2Y90_08660 [Burkholderia pyrrocinia]